MQRTAVKSTDLIATKLEARSAHFAEIAIKWDMRPISDTARERMPTEADVAEPGGPMVHGDEQLTVALVGDICRKADFPGVSGLVQPVVKEGASVATGR